MQINRILYHSIQTLIKIVFPSNFAHALLMSFLRLNINCTEQWNGQCDVSRSRQTLRNRY